MGPSHIYHHKGALELEPQIYHVRMRRGGSDVHVHSLDCVGLAQARPNYPCQSSYTVCGHVNVDQTTNFGLVCNNRCVVDFVTDWDEGICITHSTTVSYITSVDAGASLGASLRELASEAAAVCVHS